MTTSTSLAIAIPTLLPPSTSTSTTATSTPTPSPTPTSTPTPTPVLAALATADKAAQQEAIQQAPRTFRRFTSHKRIPMTTTHTASDVRTATDAVALSSSTASAVTESSPHHVTATRSRSVFRFSHAPSVSRLTVNEQRQLDSVEAAVGTLTFQDADVESAFRSVTAPSNSSIDTLIVAAIVVALILITIIQPAINYSVTYNAQIALFTIAAVVYIGAIVIHNTRTLTQSVWDFTAVTTAAMLWAIASVWNDGTFNEGADYADATESARDLILFVVAMFLTHRSLSVTALALTFLISALTYVIASCIFHAVIVNRYSVNANDTTNWFNTLINCAFLIVAAAVVGIHHYWNQMKQRQFYAQAVACNRALSVMKSELITLRNDLYTLVVEKCDVTEALRTEHHDHDNHMQTAALNLIASLERDGVSDTSQLRHCLDTISRTRNLNASKFQHKHETERLDEETTRWLLTLVEAVDASHLNVVTPVHTSSMSVGSQHRGEQTSTDVSQSTSMHKTNSLSMSLSSDEEKCLNTIQSRLDDYNFDVFEVCKLTAQRPLFFLGLILFKRFHLCSKFNIPTTTLSNWLRATERGYQDKPYHNSIHAADVLRSTYFFLCQGRVKNLLNDLDILASLIAAAIHDFDHPGVSNAFLVKSRHEKAILYNDRSVLENHHLASAFLLMHKTETNILCGLTVKQWEDIRKSIIEMVLATDLAHHFAFVSDCKNAFTIASSSLPTSSASLSAPPTFYTVSTLPSPLSDSIKLLIQKLTLKCADVHHATKTLPLHKVWTERIITEFFAIGDSERELGLPISPFMDRHKANVAKAQIGFIEFIVRPMFDILERFLAVSENVMPSNKEMRENLEYWKLDEQEHNEQHQ